MMLLIMSSLALSWCQQVVVVDAFQTPFVSRLSRLSSRTPTARASPSPSQQQQQQQQQHTLYRQNHQNRNYLDRHQCTHPQQQQQQRGQLSRLFASPDNQALIDIGFVDTFTKWKFLQQLMDQEVSADRVNELVYCVVMDLDRRRQEGLLEEEYTEWMVSTEFDDALDIVMEEVDGQSTYPVLGTLPSEYDDELAEYMPREYRIDARSLDMLEGLFPPLEESPDSHTSAWDVLEQLHGKDAVKVRRKNPTEQWNGVATISRVLVYLNFLTDWETE